MKNKIRIVSTLFVLSCLLLPLTSLAVGDPVLSMAVSGTITLDGANMATGTVLRAYCGNTTTEVGSVTLTTAGQYGPDNTSLPVNDCASGTTIYVQATYGSTLTEKKATDFTFTAAEMRTYNIAFTDATSGTDPVSVAVTPASASIVAGNTQQFTATVTYYDATTADMTTSCAWSSSANAATIGATTGLATGVSAGTATITAAYGALSDTATLTVTAAASGGGGGGGGAAPSAPAMPTTTDGDVTATRASGGMTTISVSGGGTASIKVPAYAVTANTKVSVEAVATTEEGLGEDAFAIMTGGYTIVGDYVYEITASAGGDDVTEFSKKFTITLTYTDAQIAGLSETSLTISYWDADEEKWFALPTTLDKATNTLTAKTDHLTYFAILSGIGKSVDIGKPASQMTQAELRAAILNILTQIKELQAILAEMRGVPGRVKGCVISSFNRTLKAGMSGDDVKCMQIILNSSPDTQIADSGPGSPGNETNYFGQLTKAAAVKFQEKHMNEVLKPHGLNKGTGFVGKTTRAKLNKLLK